MEQADAASVPGKALLPLQSSGQKIEISVVLSTTARLCLPNCVPNPKVKHSRSGHFGACGHFHSFLVVPVRKRKPEIQGPRIRLVIWGYGSNPLVISYANNRMTAVLLLCFSSTDSSKTRSTRYFLTDVILLLHSVSIFSAFTHCFSEGSDSSIFLLKAETFSKWGGISPPTSFLREGWWSVLSAGHSSDSYAGVGRCLLLSSSLYDTVQSSRSHHLCANCGLLHGELRDINFLCVWEVEAGLALGKW